MTEKVIRTVEEYRMFSGGEHVTAALSGGADSVCLLLVLKRLEKRYGLTIDAIHINHCIRGAEADRDEDFCRRLCESLGVNLTVKRIDVPKLAALRKQSLEQAARDIRYEEFKKHCKGGLTATAHTASDNAETVILNIARGTGLKGVCGIPPVRDNIVRPLIDVSRQEVEEFLAQNGQDYVTDSTNLENEFTRNRIRHNIIPEILQINNGFYKTFCAELKIFSEENNYIENAAKTAYNICIDNGALCGLESFEPVIRKRCILRFLKENSVPVSYDRINAIDSILENGGKINLTERVFAVCRKNILTLLRLPENTGEIEAVLHDGENSIFCDKIFYAEIKDGKDGIIDTDKVCGKIILRNRRQGDKIRLAGRNFTSSVKKLLQEKIRTDARPYIHFLADDEGVIFVERIGPAERVRTDDSTRKSLHIRIKDVKENV